MMLIGRARSPKIGFFTSSFKLPQTFRFEFNTLTPRLPCRSPVLQRPASKFAFAPLFAPSPSIPDPYWFGSSLMALEPLPTEVVPGGVDPSEQAQTSLRPSPAYRVGHAGSLFLPRKKQSPSRALQHRLRRLVKKTAKQFRLIAKQWAWPSGCQAVYK